MTNTIERPLGIERQQITIGELEDRAYELKEKLLRLCGSYEGAVHIGGDLSVADILTALFQYGTREREITIRLAIKGKTR